MLVNLGLDYSYFDIRLAKRRSVETAYQITERVKQSINFGGVFLDWEKLAVEKSF